MRFIFAKHDHAFQIKTIREALEQHRSAASSEPDAFEMHPVYDDILGQLSDHFLAHWKDQLTLLALGGYGRKEMSPYSDIDLLFLTAQIHSEGYTGIRNILRLLWMPRWNLHSVRTVKMRSKQTRTGCLLLMDVRHVWGSEDCAGPGENGSVISETNPLISIWAEGEIRRTCSEFTQTISAKPYVKEAGSLRHMQLIGWLCPNDFDAPA
jgi:[protein-PII] uridylyltransferase